MIFCLYSSCQVRLDPYCRSFQSGTVSAHSPPRGAIQVFIEMALVNKISTHAPHARRGEFNTIHATTIRFFLLTRLMRGAASSTQSTQQQFVFFYSRASCEARQLHLHKCPQSYYFYSRASCEARRLWGMMTYSGTQFLLTRLMRGAATLSTIICRSSSISTHAPHARRGDSLFCTT